MIIESKFNFGNRVYGITLDKVEIYKECDACTGKGYIKLDNGATHGCPRCYTGKQLVGTNAEWRLSAVGVIKNIRVNLYQNSSKYNEQRDYMLDSTGVENGQIWNELNIFLTEEEAKLEIEKRNSQERKL